MDLQQFIRDVPDFPKPGIVFKDITPLLRSHEALDYTSHALAGQFKDSGITAVAGIESRGFIFGTGVARVLGAGFVPIRKPGKLPWKTRRGEYTLEYGSGVLEIHEDAVTEHDRVLLIDDLLATGGTAACAATLIRECGATVVAAGFVIELTFLDGVPIHSLLSY
jgi:adenine phosphoribosyltransferase